LIGVLRKTPAADHRHPKRQRGNAAVPRWRFGLLCARFRSSPEYSLNALAAEKFRQPLHGPCLSFIPNYIHSMILRRCDDRSSSRFLAVVATY